LRAQFQAFREVEVAIADLELVLKLDPSLASAREFLAEVCNRLAWSLAANPSSRPALDRALVLSLRAIELQPNNPIYLNTRGVILYRDGQLAEAVPYLEKSLAARQGQTDGSDLFFLAMAHHRLGHREEARRCLDRVVTRQDRQSLLTDMYPEELKAFWAEAKAVLASPPGQPSGELSGQPKVKDRPAP
jgi:tetratricopeptide (TPR) repeat protein